MLNNDSALIIISQFLSVTVVPMEIPKICVCTAAATPLEHILLLIVVIEGEIAEGGGDFTVVSDLLVESVTIGCAYTTTQPIQNRTNAAHTLSITFIVLPLEHLLNEAYLQ
jgi:hypothetical protein